MATRNKKSNLNPLLRMALKNELKKQGKTEEEQAKIMQAFESLDMKTLMTDPEAFARVKNDPAGELRNFVHEDVDVYADLNEG